MMILYGVIMIEEEDDDDVLNPFTGGCGYMHKYLDICYIYL